MLPYIYSGVALAMSGVILVIMYAAGAMKGYPDTVYDSEFKVFINGAVTGDQFVYAKPGSNADSGTDWSQGWECYGPNAVAQVEPELEKKDATEAALDAGMKTLCEAAQKDDAFICCTI